EPELPHEPQRNRGKGFVDLDQVDVIDGHLGLAQCLTHGRTRTGEHDRRVRPAESRADDAGTRAHTAALAERFVAEQRQGRAVDDAGGVARSVHVVDLVYPVVLLLGYRVEPTRFADISE